MTGADGNASATFTLPDSLTTWRATSLALTKSTQVGQETREVKTNKPIMVRPQVPRYFVQGDKATVSAIVTNNTSESQQITVKLGVSGLQFLGIYDQLTSMDYKPEKPSPDPIRSFTTTSRSGSRQ